MAITGTIRRYLKYPLMWVMLLWALTLPGHELAVYSYLVKGTAAEVAPSLKSVAAESDDFSVKQQAVQVFLEANTAPAIVLNSQQLLRSAFQLFAFAPPIDAIPTHAFRKAGAEQITQFLLVAIQPNAP